MYIYIYGINVILLIPQDILPQNGSRLYFLHWNIMKYHEEPIFSGGRGKDG